MIDEPQKIGCIDSTIIGLHLVDVKIVRGNITIVDEQRSDCDNSPKEGVAKKIINKIKMWFSKD